MGVGGAGDTLPERLRIAHSDNSQQPPYPIGGTHVDCFSDEYMHRRRTITSKR